MVKLSVPERFRRGSLRGDEAASVASGLALLDLLERIRPSPAPGSRISAAG